MLNMMTTYLPGEVLVDCDVIFVVHDPALKRSKLRPLRNQLPTEHAWERNVIRRILNTYLSTENDFIKKKFHKKYTFNH